MGVKIGSFPFPFFSSFPRLIYQAVILALPVCGSFYQVLFSFPKGGPVISELPGELLKCRFPGPPSTAASESLHVGLGVYILYHLPVTPLCTKVS